jgi:hypothetical protein
MRSMSVGKRVTAVLLMFLAVDLCLFDRIRATGLVLDASNQQGIPNAYLVATVRGDRPYLPVPHSPRRNGVCIRTIIASTDSAGRFDIDRVTLNSIFINKRMTVAIFADGWMADVVRPDMSSSFGSWPTPQTIRLQQESPVRIHYHGANSGNFEKTRSATFDSLQRFIDTDTCEEDRVDAVAIRALRRMGEISSSSEERDLTLAYCKDLRRLGVQQLACDESLFQARAR